MRANATEALPVPTQNHAPDAQSANQSPRPKKDQPILDNDKQGEGKTNESENLRSHAPCSPTKVEPTPNSADLLDGDLGHISLPECIDLKHRFFTVFSDTYFRKLNDEAEPVVVLPLGTATVVLKIKNVIKELELPPDNPDLEMLKIISKALDYVPRISNEDSLPKELLTGDPSWEIDDHHKSLAQAKIFAHIIEWISEDESLQIDKENFQQFLDDPETKNKTRHAFQEAAENLGLGRENAQQVTELVNTAASELAYIEALRTRISVIRKVAGCLEIAEKTYEKSQRNNQIIKTNKYMISLSLKEFLDYFENIDGKFLDISSALENLNSFTEDIRKTRDKIWRALWAWGELEEKWSAHSIAVNRSTEDLLSETFRFLAQRYLPQKEWELMFRTNKSNEASSAPAEMPW